MKREYIYYGGEWVRPHLSKPILVENPATEEIFSKVATATKEDVELALDSVKKGFYSWKKTSMEERIKYVNEFIRLFEEKKDEIREDIVKELGVTQWFSKIHVDVAIAEMRVLVEEIQKVEFTSKIENALIFKEPYGVVACISPWNYPALQITRKIIPALLTGNTVILKPPSATPLAAWHIADCIDRAGFPAGTFAMVAGSGSTVGEWICKSEKVDVISFTGSEEVGKKMYEYAKYGIKHLVLELGGKSASIILPSGDMKEALKGTFSTVFFNVGQTCTARTRLLVPKDRLEECKEMIQEMMPFYKVGNPNDEDVRVGSMYSKEQFEIVKEYIELGLHEGAKLLVGEVPTKSGKGYFIEPCIFVEVKNDMRIAQEEIFGPVLSIITYETIQEAIDIANDNRYGLAGAIYGNQEEAIELAKNLEAGYIAINNAYGSDRAPFGGYKASGIGKENGIYALEELLQVKSVFINE